MRIKRFLRKLKKPAIVLAAIIGVLAAMLCYNNLVPVYKVPARVLPNPNGWDDFVEAGKMVKKIDRPGPYADFKHGDSWSVARMEAFVKANEPALAVMRRGFAKDCLHQETDAFPPTSDARDLTRILQGVALCHTKLGDYAAAADAVLDGFELNVSAARGGALISDLVDCMDEALIGRKLPEIIAKLDAKQLERVASRLETIESKRWPLREAILQEGCCTNVTFSKAFNSRAFRAQMMNPLRWGEQNPLAAEPNVDIDELFDSDKPLPEPPKPIALIWPNARYAFTNKAAVLGGFERFYRAYAAEQKGPYTGKSSLIAPDFPFMRDTANIYDRASRKHAAARVRVSLLLADIAIRRFRLDHGAYPAGLDQLVPKYLKSLPPDPFSREKPLRYIPASGGCLLYSLGPDLKDDGGKPSPHRGDWQNGDILLSGL